MGQFLDSFQHDRADFREKNQTKYSYWRIHNIVIYK